MNKYRLLSLCFLSVFFIQVALSNSLKEVRYFPEFEEEAIIEPLPPNELAVPTSDDVIGGSALDLDDLFLKITRGKRLIGKLDKSSIFSLPVGIYDNADDPNYIVAIDSANIHPDHATFNAYMMITNPMNGKKLRFKSGDTRFTFGNGLEGPIEMDLLDTCSIPVTKGVTLKINPTTKAYWDCNGFKEMNLVGQLNFSGETFVRVNSKGEPINQKMVVPINVVVSSLSDFFFEFSMPAFKIKGFDDAFFQFDQVALDMSERENSVGLSFPEGYPNTYSGEMFSLWQGLFVKEATVALTRLERKTKEPIIFSARNLLWDEYGLTCSVTGSNLVSLDEGVLGGWPFSLTQFEMAFVAGDFKKAAFQGELVPSGYDAKTPLAYDAMFDFAGNYRFGVSLGRNLNFNLMMATVNLASNSTIDIEVIDKEFRPSAMLYGDISLACSKGGGDTKKMLTTPSLRFEGMHIATVTPRFKVDVLELSGVSSSKLGGFPVTFKDFKFESRDNDALFSFSTVVNLKESGEEGFGGETNLSVVGDMRSSRWKFKKVEVNHIHIDASKPNAYTLVGDVWFIRGDEVYGDGFSGQITASFSKFAKIEASALFGNVDGYRYFNVDALLSLETGIQAGPLTLFGFGGGLSDNMRQAAPDESVPAFAQSLSGLSYVPDESAGIGIMAAVQFGVIKRELIQAEVKFQIIFSDGGGIDQISFLGEASVMSAVSQVTESGMMASAAAIAGGGEVAEQKGPPIRLRMYMLLDFKNNSFFAKNEVFINVLGVIKGIGANDRAGWTVISIDDGKWYVHVGTPTDPVGINLFGVVKTRSYFMAGHGIPDAMPMHPKVLEILDKKNSDFDGDREKSGIAIGNGFAFGCSFDFDTGNMSFLMFYAQFALGFGFDIMLIEFPDEFYCEGHPKPMGIDQWYAKGQAYVYFSGEIGIKVKLFFKTKKYPILKIQCAAAMRAEGPNPFWAKGIIGGKYNIFGGMIKGKCSFEVEVGEKCKLAVSKSVSEQLAELEIIGDISPADNTEDVNIFALPQVVFNMPVGKDVKISEDMNTHRYFKINLDKCKVQKISQGGMIDLEKKMEWNSGKTVLALSTDEIFDMRSRYKVEAEVTFLEKIEGNWVAFKDENGTVLKEVKTVTFSTGDKPGEIPDDIIAYSYPLDRMLNFYKNESKEGYIGFKRGITAFFNPQEGWAQKVRFTDHAKNHTDVGLSYNQSRKEVVFSIPGTIKNREIYSLELVDVPVMANKGIDRNVSSNSNDVLAMGDSITATITTREAESEIQDAEDQSFYKLHFRCSRYNTFKDKIGKDEITIRYLKNVSPGIDILMSTLYPNELFDGYEIKGMNGLSPLIQVEGEMDESDWYQNNMHKLLYQDYPLHREARITSRNVGIGIPPKRDIQFKQVEKERLLSTEEIETGTFICDVDLTHIDYVLPVHWANDYQEIRNKLANIFYEQPKPDKVDYILKHPFWPIPSRGNYPIKMKYVLPGRNTVTTDKKLNLKNIFDIEQIDYHYEEDMF